MPGVTPVVQVLPVVKTTNSAESVPEMAVLTVSDAILPTFEMVRSSVLVVVWLIVPKASEVGDTETSVVAVPLSASAGLEPPLVVRVRVPAAAPTAVGLNSTGRTQLAPPARLVVQVLPVLEMAKPAPLMAGARVKDAVPVLGMVRLMVDVVP